MNKKKLDIHNYASKYEGSKRNFQKDIRIPEEDKKHILRFIDEYPKDLSIPRKIKYLNTLKLIRLKLGKPFLEANKGDIQAFVNKVREADYSEHTKQSYKVIIKRFYRWLLGADEEYPPMVKWISTVLNEDKIAPITSKDLLTDEEIRRLIEKAYNDRDRAFIALITEAGLRVSEIGNMTINAVEFQKHGAIITVGGKTGYRTIPIFTSLPYLSKWINNHPERDNPEAPLWIKIGTNSKGTPLDYGSIRALLIRLYSRAGVKKRANPHLCRHTAATNLSRKLNHFQMCQYMGWEMNSRQPQIYIKKCAKNLQEAFFKMHNIEPDKEKVVEPIKCPRCHASNPPNNPKCFSCNLDFEKNKEEIKERHKVTNVLLELLNHPEMQKTFKKLLSQDNKLMEEVLSMT